MRISKKGPIHSFVSFIVYLPRAILNPFSSFDFCIIFTHAENWTVSLAFGTCTAIKGIFDRKFLRFFFAFYTRLKTETYFTRGDLAHRLFPSLYSSVTQHPSDSSVMREFLRDASKRTFGAISKCSQLDVASSNYTTSIATKFSISFDPSIPTLLNARFRLSLYGIMHKVYIMFCCNDTFQLLVIFHSFLWLVAVMGLYLFDDVGGLEGRWGRDK